MSNLARGLAVFLVTLCSGGVQTVLAMGGGGPPVSTMTRSYCTEMVVNKGITDIARFEAEVRKCIDDPVTYPPAYRPSGWR